MLLADIIKTRISKFFKLIWAYIVEVVTLCTTPVTYSVVNLQNIYDGQPICSLKYAKYITSSVLYKPFEWIGIAYNWIINKIALFLISRGLVVDPAYNALIVAMRYYPELFCFDINPTKVKYAYMDDMPVIYDMIPLHKVEYYTCGEIQYYTNDKTISINIYDGYIIGILITNGGEESLQSNKRKTDNVVGVKWEDDCYRWKPVRLSVVDNR